MCAGTVTVNDSLDLLAEFMGCGDSVAEVTNKVGSFLQLCRYRQKCHQLIPSCSLW